MRAFDQGAVRTREDIFHGTDEAAGFGAKFLEQDSGESIVLLAVIPKHVDEPLAPVVIVKQRGVEAAAVEENGLGPRTGDGWSGYQIVVGDLVRVALPIFHIGVNQIEESVRIREAGSPDPAGI